MVFNFNSFGNIAKACSTSAVIGTQTLQANHALIFWVSPGWTRLEAHWSLGYLTFSEAQRMAPLCPESERALCSVMAELSLLMG